MMMTTELIGNKFEGEQLRWIGCAIGNDGCLYSVPRVPRYCRSILKINPSNDSIELIHRNLLSRHRKKQWGGCTTGPDGCIYGFPKYCKEILKYDPMSQEVTVVQIGADRGEYHSAGIGADGMMYLISDDGQILRYDPLNQSNSMLVFNGLQDEDGGCYCNRCFQGAVMAGDGCIYLIPYDYSHVMRFNLSDKSYDFIGDDFGISDLLDGEDEAKWRGAVLGPDSNVYGIPFCHNYILKINVATQTTSLVGPDLGEQGEKYSGGVLGRDNCIYMIPSCTEFVLKFNPITGTTSTVGESLGNADCKYSGGMLASNGYIYLIPASGAKQVLKVKSWDNWLYLKPRLLVEQRRATRKIIQFDDELNIVQHFIIHSIDDVFRMVLEMM